MMSRFRYLAGMALFGAAVVALTGCGGGGTAGASSARTARTSIVLANSVAPDLATGASASAVSAVALRDSGGHGGGRVPLSDILSLTVTVTKVYFHYCGFDDEHGSGQPEVVLVKDAEFDPSSLTIHKGDAVHWQWASGLPHTVTSGMPGDADAGSLFDGSGSAPGDAVELIFADAGTYPYFSKDDVGMSGVIRVEDSAGEHDGKNIMPSIDQNHGQGNGHGNENEGNHGEGDDEHKSSRGPLVFTGPLEVDLLDLFGLSRMLSVAHVPAASYCGIELYVENPRLVLASDPNTTITNVHLTANGRLFVRDHFVIDDIGDIIVLDFGGVHLVRAGNSGQYVLTPRLRVDVRVTEDDVEIYGKIVRIDAINRLIEVETRADAEEREHHEPSPGPTSMLVQVPELAQIKTHDDSTTGTAQVTLTFDQLKEGQIVAILGVISDILDVVATNVTVADESIDTTTL